MIEQYDRLKKRNAFMEQYKKEKIFENGLEEFDDARWVSLSNFAPRAQEGDRATAQDLLNEYKACESADYITYVSPTNNPGVQRYFIVNPNYRARRIRGIIYMPCHLFCPHPSLYDLVYHSILLSSLYTVLNLFICRSHRNYPTHESKSSFYDSTETETTEQNSRNAGF